MHTIENFKTYFDSVLIQHLQPLEDYRLKRIKVFRRIKISAFVLFAISSGSCFTQNPLIVTLSFFSFLFVVGLAFESLSKTNTSLRKLYKSRILPKILDFINPDNKYVPQQKISKAVFEKSLLFPHAIREVNGDDLMCFKVEDVDMMFCEAEVYGYGPTSKMFRGIFISATFNKFFKSKTFIFPEKTTSFFRRIKFNTLGSSFNVKLDDTLFENEFIVLSEDQVESRYILSTSLMKRIYDYKKKVNAELAFSFISDRLYCTIPNPKNLFEPALFDSFLDFNFIAKSYEPVILYTAIVNDLNLNLRIWSKQ